MAAPDAGRARIDIVRGDLTTAHVDAVVNAANARLRGGGGVDGAVHRAGGPTILADCIARFPHGLSTGQAGATTGGRLPARHVIHVVGPVWAGPGTDPEPLRSCYRQALRVADTLGVRTLAAPAVSAGIYGWPHDDAAWQAVHTVATTPTLVEIVQFVLFSEEMLVAFRSAHARLTADDAATSPP